MIYFYDLLLSNKMKVNILYVFWCNFICMNLGLNLILFIYSDDFYDVLENRLNDYVFDWLKR